MIRNTQQRRAIYNALAKSGRPLSVNEILALAQNEIKSLGIATVYRSLKALQEEGQINQVDLPGQAPRWEVPATHHHHFLCRTCDKLFEIHACPENIRRLLPDGYNLEEVYILLHGQCSACAGKTDTTKLYNEKR
jgi:Fur family transcriptional regulator, ferric uptake regulator